MRRDLPPEETSEIPGVTLSGDEPVRHEEIVKSVVVDVDKERPPGPAPPRDPREFAHVGEAPSTLVAKQGVASGVALKLLARRRRGLFLETTLIGDAK